MRANSTGRSGSGRPSLIPTPSSDRKSQKPSDRFSALPLSEQNVALSSRSTSAQKLRPASQVLTIKPTTNNDPSSRSSTPTSTRSFSAQKSRTSLNQVFIKTTPNLATSPVPIDQRKEFNLSRHTPTKPEPLITVSTPTRPRTPSRSTAVSSARELKALVGPYSFLLKELKKERSIYTKDEDARDRDMRTIMNQLALFRYQLGKKLAEDRSHEEKLLLEAWQLVYDAEEEAFGLKSKERIALEINKIHGQLIDMVLHATTFMLPRFELTVAIVCELYRTRALTR